MSRIFRWSSRAAGALLAGVPLLLAVAAPARAQSTDASAEVARAADGESGKHCMGEGRTRLTAHQHLVVQYNATGAEHHARVGLCMPLIEEPGILFDHTHLEVGVLDYLTPAYLQLGGYLEAIPIAPLVLRAEISGVGYWPLPEFNRAGYVPRAGYRDTFDNDEIGPELSGSALGFNVNLIVIPRIRLRIAPRWAIVALSQLQFEYWNVGDEDFYVNLRRDSIAAKSEWFVTNEAFAMAEWQATVNFALRFGAFDSWRQVLGSSYDANQTGAMVMGTFTHVTESIPELSVFVRGGVYTDHGFRQGEPSVLGGAMMQSAIVDF